MSSNTRRDDWYMTEREAAYEAERRMRLLNRSTENKRIETIGHVMQLPIGGAGQVEGFGPYCIRGNAYNQREGEKILIRELRMRLDVHTEETEHGAILRLILVRDKHPDGADAGLLDMMTSDHETSEYNYENRRRFDYIFDKYVVFGTTQEMWYDRYVYRRRTVVEYDWGNTGTVTDISAGNFMLIAMGHNHKVMDISWGAQFIFQDG